MAAVGRTDETQIVNDNIYDNNAKEITPEMVRTVMATLIESHFNLVDDFLQNLNYSSGVTLQEKFEESSDPLWGETGSFDVVGTVGAISGGSGIVSSASQSASGSADSEVTINLSQSISDRKIIVTIHTNNPDMSSQNDICAPVVRVASSTQIRVGLREVASEVQSIRLEILAFKISS